MDALSADWPGICRRIVAAQREIFARTTGIAARTVYEGVGEGGDRTLVIDRECEDAVFAELDDAGRRGRLFRRRLRGARRGGLRRGRPGSGGDRSDRRLAQRPPHASLPQPQHRRRLRPDSMADVEFGYVYDFGADEEFAATRGGGARLQAARRSRSRPTATSSSCSASRRPSRSGRCPPCRRSRAGLPAARRRLDRDHRRLRRLRPLRRDAQPAPLPLGRCGGRAADRARGRRRGRLRRSRLGQADLGLDARYPIAAAAGDQGLSTIRSTEA